jgi:hypothetical protein
LGRVGNPRRGPMPSIKLILTIAVISGIVAYAVVKKVA